MRSRSSLVLTVTLAAALLAAPLPVQAQEAPSAEVHSLRDQVKELEKRLKEVEGVRDHRDELADWLEEELLPLIGGEGGERLAGLRAGAADLEEPEEDKAAPESVRLQQRKSHMEASIAAFLPAGEQRDALVAWVEEILPAAEGKEPRLQTLKEVTSDMAERVAEMRGLEWKKPVMRRLIARDKVGEWMRKGMEKDLPREKAERMVRVGAEFGLVKPGIDLYEAMAGLMEGGALAFYNPATSTFYLIEGNEGQAARPTVFHELVHAVEDQHFAIDELQASGGEGESDRFLAARALVEGSAEMHTNRYGERFPEDFKAFMASQMTPENMKRQMEMLNKVPIFVIASIGMYPYKNGAAWLEEIGADTPEKLAQLFRDPPVSSEQVLHPAKFPLEGARDYPHEIATPDLGSVLGAGWEMEEEDTMGELTMGVLMAQLLFPAPMATIMSISDMRTNGVAFKPPVKAAVEGWDGDRYAAWHRESDGRVCVVWTLVWDSEKDATEFAGAYAPLLGKHVTGTKVKEMPSPVRFTRESDGSMAAVEADGNRVVVVLGGPADKVDALLAAGRAAAVTPDERDPNDAK